MEPKYGQTIDTEIEHAIVQQGFNGPPKIVSQEEFDRIVKENPQMPILMRSYAAPTADVLQDYDDMLENGEWYVDCETGGAQYGQGMYCAGVYPQEPLYQWDDPGLELDPDNPFVVVNSKHEGFKAQKVTAEGNGDLYVDTPYLTSDKDGKRRMIRLDGESGMLEDIGNGGILEESEVDDLLRDGQVFQCEPVDIGIYEDAYDKERKKGIEAAKREMEEYRQLGIRRIYEEAEPQAPVGKLRTVEFDTNGDSVYRYYDPKNITTFGDNPPPNGTVVAMVDEYGIKRGLDANTWLYSNGRLISINGQNAIEASEIEQSWQWAPVEGKCPQPEIKPQASTRLMTLDPSSKIITYEEVKRIKNMASTIRREAQQELYDAELDYCDGKPEELYTLFQVMDGREVPDHMVAEAVEFKRKNPEACEEAIKWFSSQNEKYREKVRKADKYKRFSIADPGVIATELGYDAINAEGHGNSESYTVVLNRTKVIISEQRVDIA